LACPAFHARRRRRAQARRARVARLRRQTEYRFRQFVGKSIGEEILAVRLETAKKLLADPAIPIGAVADRCGYSDDSLLRRASFPQRIPEIAGSVMDLWGQVRRKSLETLHFMGSFLVFTAR